MTLLCAYIHNLHLKWVTYRKYKGKSLCDFIYPFSVCLYMCFPSFSFLFLLQSIWSLIFSYVASIGQLGSQTVTIVSYKQRVEKERNNLSYIILLKLFLVLFDFVYITSSFLISFDFVYSLTFEMLKKKKTTKTDWNCRNIKFRNSRTETETEHCSQILVIGLWNIQEGTLRPGIITH